MAMERPEWLTLDVAQAGVQELERQIYGGGDRNFDAYLSQLQETGQKQCTVVWTKGTIAYRCRTCQVNESSAICVNCFQAGDHRYHDYVMYRSEAGGCCDCGDEASWKEEGFCGVHRRFVSDEVPHLPSHVADAASKAVRCILKELIFWIKEIYTIRSVDAPPPVDNETKFAKVYLSWLQKVCSVEALRDILCEAMRMDFSGFMSVEAKNSLEVLLSTFAKMPEALMEVETTLFLQMLYNPQFKLWYSEEVLHYYLDMILPFVSPLLSPEAKSGFKALDQSLDRVMVQLFNVPEITLSFLKHNELLECFMSVLNYVIGYCINRDVGTVNVDHDTIEAKIYGRPQGDLRLILSHPPVALYVLMEREDIVKKLLSMLSLLQWMNPYSRGQSVDFDEQIGWKSAISLELHTMAIIFQLIGRCFALCASDEESCRVALIKFARTTLSMLLSHLKEVKSSQGPINGLSLHIPLHRTLSAVICKLVLMTWGEADQGFLSALQGSLSETEVLALIEHPLKIIVWMSLVRVRQWQSNSEDSFNRLEMIYRGSFWHDQSMDLDILMLQFCAVARENMQQTIFITIAESFDLKSIVTEPLSVVGKQSKLTLKQIAILLEFMHLMLLVVRERRNTGMNEVFDRSPTSAPVSSCSSLMTALSHVFSISQKDSLRYDVIQWLCVRDQTFSKLNNAVSGFTVDHAKLTAMLQEVAVYVSPKLQERGFYQLKQECWEEFDPVFSQFYSNELEEAQERAVNIGKLNNFWRLRQPPPACPPFHRLSNLLHTQACYQLVWNVLQHVNMLIEDESTATAAEALGVIALQILAMALADVRDASSKPRKVSLSSGSRHPAPSASSLDDISVYIHGKPCMNPATGVVDWLHGDATIFRMLLDLQRAKDSIRLVDSVSHVLSLLSPYDTSSNSKSDLSHSSHAQMIDLSMEDERRKLKKQRQEAILKDFAARQQAFIDQQAGEQATFKESAPDISAADNSPFALPMEVERSGPGRGKSKLLATDQSYEPSGCAFCRCPCDGKDSATGWIALVQRYNLSNVMLSRGEVVQGLAEDLPDTPATSADSLSSLVTVVVGFDGEDASKCISIDANPNEHVRCCGHQMHQICFQRYADSLLKRHNARCPYEGKGLIDLSRMEFLCPICRRLANVLLPDINDSMALKLVRYQDEDETTMSERGVHLVTKPEMDISVYLYTESAEVDHFWDDFWQVNRNLAEVISVFASQCLRVRRDFRMEPLELEGFMLCRVLWEVLAENVVHSEVETRAEGLLSQRDEASSSASSQSQSGCLWKGDGAHWLALQQLGRLAMLGNTLPAAAALKEKKAELILQWLGLCSVVFGGYPLETEGWKVAQVDTATQSMSFRVDDSSNASHSESAGYQSSFSAMSSAGPSSADSPPDPEEYDMIADLLGVSSKEVEAVQDEVDRKLNRQEKLEQLSEEDWLWNFSTIGAGAVLGSDPFGLLITLLTAFKGCPRLHQILAMVHLAYFIAITQAACAFDALSRKGHDSPMLRTTREKYAQVACLPFLRRAAILVQILTCKPIEGDDNYRDGVAMDFVFLKRWLRLPSLDQIRHVSVNGTEGSAEALQNLWQDRVESSMFGPLLLRVPRQINLIELPEIFQDLMLQRLKAPCSNCHEVPRDPAVCLVCGKLFCSGGGGKDVHGECYPHSHRENCGIGMYLMMHSTQLLLLRSDRFCMAPSLYLDLHGEEDLELRMGHLLHLSHLRLREVRRLWATAAFDYDTHILHNSQIGAKIF